MPQLDPTWFASQLFWLAITFVVLYVLMARFVLPPLQSIMAERTQTREGDVARAQALTLEAKAAREDYERTLEASRSKALQLTSEAMLASKAKADEASRSLDAQVARQLSEAGSRIAAKKQELVSSLSPVADELASLIAHKLTQATAGASKGEH